MPARALVLIAAICCLAGAGLAEDSGKDATEDATASQARVFTSTHTGRFGGETVKYTATAGETYLLGDKGKPEASIFSVAYIRDADSKAPARPVTFVFNGGPGSASLWLHMGAFGPRRVDTPSDADDDGAPPYPIVDNPASLLDVTDLVFIDPVGTGYSIPLGKKKGEDFWGVTADAKSIARFIETWITKNKRWNSPKYLAGESYGTFRAAAVTHELEGGFSDIALNGLILISTILDLTGSDTRPGNELPYVSFLPTYAATAWYHGRIAERPESLEAFVDEARTFALNEYATALLKGDRLDAATRDKVRARLSQLTGLSETYIGHANLRVTPSRFQKELLRDLGKTVGRLDGRYKGDDYDDAGERPDSDPSFYGIDGAFVSAVNHYLGTELGVDLGRRFKPMSFEVNRNWKWTLAGREGRPSYINVAPYIGTAMRENKDFRIYVAAGYYDFATPFFGAENSLARSGIVRERVEWSYFEAGHMMYIHDPSRQRLSNEIRRFIRAGSRQRTIAAE